MVDIKASNLNTISGWHNLGIGLAGSRVLRLRCHLLPFATFCSCGWQFTELLKFRQMHLDLARKFFGLLQAAWNSSSRSRSEWSGKVNSPVRLDKLCHIFNSTTVSTRRQGHTFDAAMAGKSAKRLKTAIKPIYLLVQCPSPDRAAAVATAATHLAHEESWKTIKPSWKTCLWSTYVHVLQSVVNSKLWHCNRWGNCKQQSVSDVWWNHFHGQEVWWNSTCWRNDLLRPEKPWLHKDSLNNWLTPIV